MKKSSAAKESTLDAVLESSDEIRAYGLFKRFSDKLDSLGVEARGIERIQPYERAVNKRKQFITVMGLWLSACGGLSSMSSFYLGPLLFGLGLKNTAITGIVGMTLGCLVAAYCSLMGPRSGCRQMVSARFLFGWWFVKLVCLVSIIGVMGWSVVNCVVGGQILASMSDEKVPLCCHCHYCRGVAMCLHWRNPLLASGRGISKSPGELCILDAIRGIFQEI